jgi:hypothetical protein
MVPAFEEEFVAPVAPGAGEVYRFVTGKRAEGRGLRAEKPGAPDEKQGRVVAHTGSCLAALSPRPSALASCHKTFKFTA